MHPTPLSIIQTEDGSASLFNATLNETYHSRHGAWQESMHVFIGAGLAHRFKQTSDKLVVFEIGFGTGLNAALTLLYSAKSEWPIHYIAIEKHVLSADQQTAYIQASPLELQTALQAVNDAPWETGVGLQDFLSLHKMAHDATTATFPVCDVIFLDAFAPAVSPELWTVDMMQKYYNCLRPHGVLVTYCAKGAVRRAMQSAGFTVERLPGPKGKREMLRATKIIQS